ncbi:hypothetical protein, partial [Streptomyces alkaliterrae]
MEISATPATSRLRTPEEHQLPAYLVERIYHAARLAGLPLAIETGDAGVYLEREGPLAGPTDHVVVSWHVPDHLFLTAMDQPLQAPAPTFLNAVYQATDHVLTTLLDNSGLETRHHPRTGALTVLGITGPPPT